MNVIFYTILFIIGIVIGSYLKLEANEIPRELDLKRTHYSKNSNKEFISKLTYALIGGVSSVILADPLKTCISNFDISSIAIYCFSMVYVSTLILIAGIDKNYSKIIKKVLAFGVVSSIVYMIYIFTIDPSSVYVSVRYLLIYVMLLIVDAVLLRKFAKDSYIVNLLILLNIILVYSDFKILVYTLVMAIVAILIYLVLLKSQQNKNGNKETKINEIPVGFFVATSNIIILFMIKIFAIYFV